MTRSVSAVFDLADDGYEENNFAVAKSNVAGENANVGFFRRAVDVEGVIAWGVYDLDSRIFRCFLFDFYAAHPYPYSYSCSYSYSGSCSFLFPSSGSSSPSDPDCTS